MRRFISAIVSLVAAIALLSPAAISAWELDAMNRTINQTNFILDNQCSGTLVDLKQKLVLTNYHCVDGKITAEDREELQADGTIRKVRRFKYTDVELTQRSYQGADQVGAASYMAEIVAHDKRSDLALLRIKADTIPHTTQSVILPNGKGVVRGERVYIVGNPIMLDASVVEGVVSSTTRLFEVPWAEGEKVAFYQISGGIAGGNSGGALYNNDGYFIGVPAAGARQEFIGLAIQLDSVKSFLKKACYESVYNPSAEDATCRAAKAKKPAPIAEAPAAPEAPKGDPGW
jgi:S1-C subfamily serine protease